MGGTLTGIARYHACTYAHSHAHSPARARRQGTHASIRGDRKLTLADFEILLHALARKKFPSLDEVSAWERLLDNHLLRYGDAVPKPSPVDELFDPGVLALFHRHHGSLRQLFEHYATLDLQTADQRSWPAVKHANRSMDVDEFLMLMLNFDVVPMLLSKREVRPAKD